MSERPEFVDQARRSMLALPLAWANLPASAGNAGLPPPEVRSELPSARLQGSGRLRFLLFHVYDARLWTGPQFDAQRFDQAPLALELEYARTLYGHLIAERSIEEMRRSGDMAPEQADRWLAAMKPCFPDVDEGDRMTGIQVPGSAARFFVNGKLTGEIRDAEFTRRFFGIWLSAHTSEPGLRAALLPSLRGGS